MFYYPTVLQHRSGCFSAICEDIMDYVTVRVLPEHPSLPRPRFSLYLSSQLYYGVVIIYHRQCAFLLDEIQQSIEKLLRLQKHVRIDMPELEQTVDIPAVLMEEDLDPFFGQMRMDDMPSPSQLAQFSSFLEAYSPEHPQRTPSPEAEAPLHIASPEAITLKEAEPGALRMPEFLGEELMEPNEQDIDMLLKEPSERTVEEAVERQDEARLGEVVEAAPSSDVAPAITPPPTTSPPTRETSDQNGGMIQESTSLELEPSDVQPKRKGARRRKQLSIDRQTQISSPEMDRQTKNLLCDTVALDEVPVRVAAERRVSAEELASGPYSGVLNPALRLLWKQRAVLRRRPGRRRPREEEELEEEEEKREGYHDLSEHLSELEARRRQDDSSGQIPKDSAESGLYVSVISAPCDPQLDISKEGKTQDLTSVPVGRSAEEGPMEPIFEEEPLIQAGVALPPQAEDDTTTDSLMANSLLEQSEEIAFDSLLPPEANRRTVAQTFYKMLELANEGKLKACQAKPFDPITLTLGSHLP
ncbi:hypothetical protein ACEWY4_018798 [Coilia grayii]|uniref:Meiotic recombination protein REC8 homolog n=1 Tax=Coilia grayii TaxID=363190 RepID=A0ABD1JE87_9TELE